MEPSPASKCVSPHETTTFSRLPSKTWGTATAPFVPLLSPRPRARLSCGNFWTPSWRQRICSELPLALKERLQPGSHADVSAAPATTKATSLHRPPIAAQDSP
jgi:hypothetical protein